MAIPSNSFRVCKTRAAPLQAGRVNWRGALHWLPSLFMSRHISDNQMWDQSYSI